MERVHSHYENLRVARNAPVNVIRAAYRALAQQHHPDRNAGNPESARVMALVNEAHRVLTDPELRREHDAWIAEQELAPDATPKRNGGDGQAARTADTSQQSEVSRDKDSANSQAPMQFTDLDEAYEIFKRKLPYYVLNVAAIAALVFIFWFAGVLR